MLKNDPIANVLHIDLEHKSFKIERREDLFGEFIGGAGVAIKLLLDECPEGCDPLAPENPIILAVGPMTGEYPLGSKTVAMFKSPLTGNLGESHCGGRSAVAIRSAGFGAIVIKGKADMPVYLSIFDRKVHFRNATTLWGMGSNSTSGRVIRAAEPGAGTRTIMRIGRAGEKLVRYAEVTTETFRHFGRLGLGAVFGSKNLKAIAISGKNKLPVSDVKDYRALYDEIYNAAVQSELMKKYHDLGTSVNINVLNTIGALPTRNVTSGTFEDASTISGEYLAEHFLGRRLACTGCPVACIHIANLREPYEDEPYFYKVTGVSYDHELIYAAGSMLGIGDPEKFLKLMEMIEKVGLDAMTTGATLAWATEAFQKKLITKKHTAGIKPAWGDHEAYIEMVKLIIDQPNEFYQDLAMGSAYASEKYGGTEFAMVFGKNEMAGYHTGPAGYIGYAIGARHSHLDNAGYSIDQKKLMEQPEEIPPETVVDELVKEEEWRQILSSITVCFFARGLYPPDVVARGLKLSGFDVTPEDLDEIGKKIYKNKYAFKLREGFTLDVAALPKRIYETPSPVPYLNEEYMDKALKHFEELIQSW
ncbi:MAG TPA: aldehyde ferredoxin oxidoreductase C-terminal domain-containing protein [Candidatus Lokiarchaeia archaeon]|nr:aldehyde ferredoxin oxidoreductase C-terminal domain-containing protein [Candidatus Lokiarchaeia archaeon]